MQPAKALKSLKLLLKCVTIPPKQNKEIVSNN